MENISFIGCGSWGGALSKILSDKNIQSVMWHRNLSIIEKMEKTRVHYLVPDLKFSKNVSFTNNLEHLIENDAKNASAYKSNLEKALKDIDKLSMEVMTELNQSTSSIVFHDAYQYFEQRFGIEVIGALTVNPEVLPGAKQLAEIREVIEHESVNCLFSEPQFNPSIAETIASDTGIKSAVLDPLGAELEPGKDLYFDLIGDMASSFENC